ncbi:hypothetical protein VN97_g11842 [Penicillium thymicola]|uniref:Uncharacterized protein n=1 Tax=Penicillium thymicola TaxID=293382 RepID=A0AAI9T7C9_PENTH|nr:hypothetical protein VN97_g11842 [Penicillium thymicola]
MPDLIIDPNLRRTSFSSLLSVLGLRSEAFSSICHSSHVATPYTLTLSSLNVYFKVHRLPRPLLPRSDYGNICESRH